MLRYFFSSKKILTGEICRKKILQTTNLIGEVTSITLGPSGRHVMIEAKNQPRITKDGVTVAKHLQFQDRLEDAITTLVKKSVDGTNKFAGDGTTTSTLLIGQITKRAIRKIQYGIPARVIKQGLLTARNIGVQFIQSVSRNVSSEQQLYNVAMVSTNYNREISELIASVMSKTSHISIQKSAKTTTNVEYYSGLKIVRGLPHPEFKNHGDKAIFNYPLVMVSSIPLVNIKQVIPALQLAKKAKKQLVIFSEEISDSVLSTLIYNKRKNIVESCAISLPPYGSKAIQYLQQIAKGTSAYNFKNFGDRSEQLNWNHLGKAIKIEIDYLQTWILGQVNHNNVSAIIYAGGTTQSVLLQTYDKIVDALNSVKSAKKDGVIAGGGLTYWKLAQLLNQYEGEGKEGVKVLSQALKIPRRKLLRNLSVKQMEVSNWSGYNLKTGKMEDMFNCGIVDSFSVGKNVLIDAISLSIMLMDIQISIMRSDRNIDRGQYEQIMKNQVF